MGWCFQCSNGHCQVERRLGRSRFPECCSTEQRLLVNRIYSGLNKLYLKGRGTPIRKQLNTVCNHLSYLLYVSKVAHQRDTGLDEQDSVYTGIRDNEVSESTA